MILLFIGPSGSGKTSLVEKLDIPVLISSTTRKPRPWEVNGEHYYFVTEEEFDRIDKLEETTYDGYRYCLSRQEYEDKLKENPIVCSVMEINGVLQIKEKLPQNEVRVFYIHAPLIDIIFRLWKERGFKNMVKRVWHAIKTNEFKNAKMADYIIDNSNGRFDLALVSIKSIIKLINYLKEEGVFDNGRTDRDYYWADVRR